MKIGIIGGGVIGLTSGVVLAEAGHEIEILTRDPFEKTTSYAAGAMCYPFGVEQSPRVIEWYKRTKTVLEELRPINEVGILEAKWRRLSHSDKFELPFWFNDIKTARELVFGDPLLPENYRSGIAADFLMMAVDTYFPWLLKRLLKSGGRVTICDIETVQSISSKYDLLINATGIGARKLSNDETVYPARGQSIIVKNPGIEYHTAMQDEMFYLYPRGTQCLIGGSFDIDAWDLTPDENLTKRLLKRAGEMEPLLKNPEVLNVRVGLRPMRKEVRLELETLSNGTPLIHNYGHGGAGYTLSWGCAFDVLKIINNL